MVVGVSRQARNITGWAVAKRKGSRGGGSCWGMCGEEDVGERGCDGETAHPSPRERTIQL